MNNVFLMGFMGSGKSAVARSLAKLLWCPLIDLDARIEQDAEKSINEIFETEGEAAFRERETLALKAATQEGGVISLGGGVPTQSANRDILRNASKKGALVVYLRARPEVLAERIRRQPGKRPLIDGEGELDLEATQKRVEELMAQREPLYLECANLIIDTNDQTIFEIAWEIATAV